MKTKPVSTNGQSASEQGIADTIRLTPVKITTIDVPIVGTTELIMHNWSAKSRDMMRQAQMQGGAKKAKAPREAKDPEAEYEAAFYRLTDSRPGMPATAFKAAMVNAVRYFDGLTLVLAKQMLFVVGEGPDNLVPIEGDVRMREDTPRLSSGVPDLRYRPGFFPWSATLRIRFPSSNIDVDSVVSLVDAAGLGGVGDWRPTSPKSCTGTFGMFEVKR